MQQNVRARLVITGVVQGVYYRVTARKVALNSGITGWIKNRPDGAVEALIEGNRDKILKFIDWCRQGPPAAQVSDVQVEWGDFKGEYQNFSIIG
jgi:acylphosphatase